MKLYDKIYVPDFEDGSFWVDIPESKTNKGEWADIKKDVIVLTANELWDMWAECAADQVDAETRLKNIEMFNRYLTSKGIKLNPNG